MRLWGPNGPAEVMPALSHGWWKGWRGPKPLTADFRDRGRGFNALSVFEMLSAGAHTAESFGRAIMASVLAAAAEKGETFASGRAIKLELNVTVTPIRGIGAWVCVGVPGFGTLCTIERKERLD